MNIILFGPMGCGRSTAANYFIKTTNCLKYNISSYITKITNMMNYQQLDNKFLYQLFAEQCRVMFGSFVWNNLLMELVQKQQDLYLGYGEMPPDIVIADGRKFADLIYWRDRDFTTIGINVDDEIRRDRLIQKDGEDPIKYFNHIIEEEAKICISQCDYQIDNNGSLVDMYQQIDKIITAEKIYQSQGG